MIRRLLDYVAISKWVWILAFLFTVGLMSYAGVWTVHPSIPTELTE